MGPPPVLVPRLGNLHKRRASASPEKFNTGKFEPLPLRIDTSFASGQGTTEPPAKRARLENKIEIGYDALGTPHIASVTPIWALPSGRRIAVPLNSAASLRVPADEAFSVLNGFLRHGDLLLLLASYLNIPSLISLYSISKPFHAVFNRHFTAFIVACMRTWAPNADKIWPWRCYQSLCIKDPNLRQKSSFANKEVETIGQDLRDVPSLRWLQMVVWRQGVCKDMLIQLATKGLRCPPGTLDAVKKMWFVLDLPLNAHRIALCRTEAYITKKVIYNATLFFLKVDMAFTDPACAVYPLAGPHTNMHAYPARYQRKGHVGCDLREMLISEKSFTPLWRVLRGWSPDPKEPAFHMNRLDVLKLWVRHKYKPRHGAPAEAREGSIMGIPWDQVGTAGLERTGVSVYHLADGSSRVVTNPSFRFVTPDQQRAIDQQLYPHRKQLLLPTDKPREPLLRPDELLIRESVRRRMSLHGAWGRMMLYGFCDYWGRNLPVRSEDELLKWSNGNVPKHPLYTDEELARLQRSREDPVRTLVHPRPGPSTPASATTPAPSRWAGLDEAQRKAAIAGLFSEERIQRLVQREKESAQAIWQESPWGRLQFTRPYVPRWTKLPAGRRR
ncbi:hypothetical protein Tdes44962_MAKER01532 [Teratosphaeria destructans]|uniref:F-box domain-containing protein n=1 Tax=Teratosphaeria destructans TaxID=418781 RepID=A0A9W7SYF3_9PEZI|nr:hypothetical protein Tdes44962_MAKER01532 [Teratosphaeria destructans]